MTENNAADQLMDAVRNAQSLSLIPILQLIKSTIGADYSSKLGVDINTKTSTISISSKDNKKINVFLSLVDSKYNIMDSFNECGLYHKHINTFLDIEEEHIKEQTIEIISYLMKCVLLTFNNIKTGDLKFNISEYQIEMDENTKIYMLADMEQLEEDRKYISVVFSEY